MIDKAQFKFWNQEHNFRDAAHPVVRHFAKQRIDFINSYIPLQQVRTYLDIGSGNGVSLSYLPENIMTYALDYSRHYLRKNRCPNKIISDASTLPFKDGSFDVVCCWEVLHHIPDFFPAILEMKRVSRKYVYVFEPNLHNPVQFVFSFLSREHRMVYTNRYTLSNMKKHFSNAGLRISIARTVGWVFPNKTPSRLMPLFRKMPFTAPFAISNFILAEKI